MSEPLEDWDVWPAIDSFFSTYGLAQCQIEPFNEYIYRGIPSVIEHFKIIEEGEYKVEFGEIIIHRPSLSSLIDGNLVKKLTPAYCEETDNSYLSELYVDITITNSTGIGRLYPHVHIGSVPSMVMSDLCNLVEYKNSEEDMAKLKENVYEKGGFFVIGGARKVVTAQQRSACNSILVYNNRTKEPKYEFFAYIRSSAAFMSTETYVGIRGGLISVTVPYIDGPGIPLGIIFRALGCDTESMMVKLCARSMKDTDALVILSRSLEYSWECNTQEAALQYIGRRGKKFTSTKPSSSSTEEDDEARKKIDTRKMKEEAISYARYLLAAEFLPHLGTKVPSFYKKQIYLGYMVQRLLDVVLGRQPLDDRDHSTNKRMATTGLMMKETFYNAFKAFVKEIRNAILTKAKGSIGIHTTIKPSTITNSMCSALTNNMWGKKTPSNGRSQTYECFNFAAGLANIRKFMTSMNDEGGKVEKPRHLHCTHWGKFCPSETPEGKRTGLVLNGAVMCLITTGYPAEDVTLIIIEFDDFCPIEDVIGDEFSPYFYETKIMVNGDLIGYTTRPDDLATYLRNLRRSGGLGYETSVTHNRRLHELRISTDEGRMYTPLLIVHNGEIKLKKEHVTSILNGEWNDNPGGVWYTLLTNGYIEFIDSEEWETLYIAFYPSDVNMTFRNVDGDDTPQEYFTHCELHPSLMFGIGASLIPFPDHNQSPRNCYQAAMGKQAIGIPGTNCYAQTKNKMHVLLNPQKPLVSTTMSKIIGFDDLPAGQNAVVFICPHKGFNQEDSIVVNNASIQRGFGDAYVLYSYHSKIREAKGEVCEIPLEEECYNFRGNPSKLDPDTALVKEGVIVEDGDILIGMTLVVGEGDREYRGKPKKNISQIYSGKEPGTVHNVCHLVDAEGYPLIRVVVAQHRPPVEGDKFSARHGQKGTCGIRADPWDLPFTEEGIVPDLMVNPLAFPSRMTVAMFIEAILGKKIASTNSGLYKTPIRKAFILDDPEYDNPPDYHVEEDPFDNLPLKRTKEYKPYHDGDATSCKKEFKWEDICEDLRKQGYDQFSDEIVYNGMTGEQMKCTVFTGIVYYQRLKHMVIDKIHARAQGGHVGLTKQPMEGRRYGGGFKVGLMEVDVIIAHGGLWFARDRLMEQSDETRMWYCKRCGLQASDIVPKDGNGNVLVRGCLVCESFDVALVKLPYGTKLMIQENIGMNIAIRVITTSGGEPGDTVLLTNGQKFVGKGTLMRY